MDKFLVWRNDWLTVIDSMNRQHLAIAEDINGLAEIYLEGRNTTPDSAHMERVSTLMDHLCTSTEQHFSEEEKMMVEHNYPHLEKHQVEHRMMLAELKHYKKECSENADCISIVMLMSLKSWFVNHVVESDKDLALYVLNRTTSEEQVGV